MGAIGESARVFVARNDPLIALAPGPGRDARKVGAGLRFREGAGAEIVSAQHGRNFLPPFGGGTRNPPIEFVATRKQACDAHPTAGELFGDESVFECSQSEPAVFFRNENTEESQLTHSGDELARN